MPEVKITIGGREFEVACKTGEEKFLQSAAKLLDVEASALAEALGRLPESRMLLMSGLMLADKTASLEDDLRRQVTGESAPDNSAAVAEAVQRAEKAETRLQAAREELVSVKEQLEHSQGSLEDSKEQLKSSAQVAADAKSAGDTSTSALATAHAEIQQLQDTQALAFDAMDRMVASAEAAAGITATAEE